MPATTSTDARDRIGFLLAPSTAKRLALFRIFVGLAVLRTLVGWKPWVYGELPHEFLAEGAKWLPYDAGVMRLLSFVLGAATVAVILGWRARWCAALAAGLATYLFGVMQAFGKVDHFHHLVWFTVLLSLSPCADAYAIGGRKDEKHRSVVYGFPLRCAWLLVGLIYLFPGVAKLSVSGLDWAFSDNLRNLILVTSFRSGEPAVNLVSSPGLLKAAGIFVLAFELGFLFLIFNRVAGRFVALAGFLVHIGIGLTLSIWFIHLLLCYVVFADAVLPPRGALDERVPSSGVQLACVALVAVVAIVGAMGVERSWPVAQYPSFAHIASPFVRTTRVTATTSQGSVELGPPPGITHGRWENILQNVRPSDRRRIRGLARAVKLPADASHLSVNAIVVDTRTGSVVRRLELLSLRL